MDEIRKPFFVAALIAWLLVVLVEVGAGIFLPIPEPSPGEFTAAIKNDKSQRDSPPLQHDIDDMFAQRKQNLPRPGYAIESLIAFDGLAFMGLFFMGAGLVISRRLVGRVQGIISLIVALITIIVGIIVALLMFALLMVMLGLLLAVPFGTLAYLAIWGFFDTGGAATTLGIILFLKIAAAVLLLLAQQDFIKNKGLVILIALSLLLTLLISFLQGFPPGILVSITDVLAALIVLIVAIIWAIILLIGSIIATVKAIPPEKTSS